MIARETRHGLVGDGFKRGRIERKICREPVQADLVLSYSGLHMVSDPEPAVGELARCLKPGGRLVGTTFLAGGTRRARALLALGARRGHPLPPAREDLLRWLTDAGITDVQIGPQSGFAAFSGRRA